MSLNQGVNAAAVGAQHGQLCNEMQMGAKLTIQLLHQLSKLLWADPARVAHFVRIRL